LIAGALAAGTRRGSWPGPSRKAASSSHTSKQEVAMRIVMMRPPVERLDPYTLVALPQPIKHCRPPPYLRARLRLR
jgi:hypothetical protein